jgi:hypothetical protein
MTASRDLFAATLLFSYVVISGVAHADPAIAKKTHSFRAESYASFQALREASPEVQAAAPFEGGIVGQCTYSGGPKSSVWACQ